MEKANQKKITVRHLSEKVGDVVPSRETQDKIIHIFAVICVVFIFAFTVLVVVKEVLG